MEYPMRIAGEPVSSPAPQPVSLPFDGSTVGTIFQATPDQVEAAVAAARRAAPIMRDLSLHDRSTILRKAFQLLSDRADSFAHAISSESGKPLKEARLEAERAALTLLFSAEEAHRLHGEVVPMDASPAGKGHMAITVREPLGVIAAITPFNFPLNLAMHKIGPALAAGNTVVHKPASTTPISAIMMADLFLEAGLPKGALNVITGPGGSIGEQLCLHKNIAMITFTGSPEVGLRLRNLAGMKRVTLELGNNSAVIIEPDADLDEAAARCVAGSFAHSGQVCISVQRIYVHHDVHNAFTDRIVNLTRQLKIGHPYEPSTDISSLITENEAARVESWISDAVSSGANLLTGGHRSRATLEPSVLTNVPEHSPIMAKEAFGPVVGINPYQSLPQAIDLVNHSDYGLQAAIYTRDIQKAFRTAHQVHTGGFLINQIPQFRVDHMPYGGVKLSGTGREGPKYAIEEMTEPKLICWKI